MHVHYPYLDVRHLVGLEVHPRGAHVHKVVHLCFIHQVGQGVGQIGRSWFVLLVVGLPTYPSQTKYIHPSINQPHPALVRVRQRLGVPHLAAVHVVDDVEVVRLAQGRQVLSYRMILTAYVQVCVDCCADTPKITQS